MNVRSEKSWNTQYFPDIACLRLSPLFQNWKSSYLVCNIPLDKPLAQPSAIYKSFYKFYHRLSELIDKYNIGLKSLLQQGISELLFSGDLVYKPPLILQVNPKR